MAFRDIKSIFSVNGKISAILIAVFVIINCIVLHNSIRHDPEVGYDVSRFIRYIDTLSEGRLPTRMENYEYFSPPMSFAVPALAKVVFNLSPVAAGKLYQYLNVVYSLLATLLLLGIAGMVSPSSISARLNSLLLLGILPVYYKTFAFVRPEPLLTMMALLCTWMTMRAVRKADIVTSVIYGLCLGVMMLTRQWGFFLILSICIFWALLCLKKQVQWRRASVVLGMALCVAIAVSSWFYIGLKVKYGKFSAFNKEGAASFSLSNQPKSFYVGKGNGKLFSQPLRPGFPNQVLPILYAETWGDYWCYFKVVGSDAAGAYEPGSSFRAPDRVGFTHNLDDVGPYLARMNLLGLFPSLLLIAGVGWGIGRLYRFFRGDDISELWLLCVITLVVGAAGYMWFLIMYSTPVKGDTIKTTYILQLFPFVCLMGGAMLSAIHERWPKLYYSLCMLLLLFFLHALPAMLTSYV